MRWEYEDFRLGFSDRFVPMHAESSRSFRLKMLDSVELVPMSHSQTAAARTQDGHSTASRGETRKRDKAPERACALDSSEMAEAVGESARVLCCLSSRSRQVGAFAAVCLLSGAQTEADRQYDAFYAERAASSDEGHRLAEFVPLPPPLTSSRRRYVCYWSPAL